MFKPGEALEKLTDPEVKEFVEYLHEGWELGMEDKVHELGKMGIENFDLFSKFLKTITSDPHFFDSVNSIVHTAQHIIH